MKKSLVALILLLSSCATSYEKIAKKTSRIAAEHGFSEKIYQTEGFKIYTLQRISDPNKKVARVYFEGDGKAYIRKNIASLNPTPTSFFTINLLTEDHSSNLVYVARPCQYVKDPKCYTDKPERYWTNARFSREVIDSINEVMKNFVWFKLELVGYSGGATIMKHVA